MKYFLTILVFVGGVTGLALEMSASHLLGAYFGISLYIWSCLIGMLHLDPTISYLIGRRLADRNPSEQVLCILTTMATFSIFAIPIVCKSLLSWPINVVAQISVSSFFSSSIRAVLLFAIPVTLLGLVSPFAIRLMTKDIGDSGSLSGSLYAISTIGSLFQSTTRESFLQLRNQMTGSGALVLNTVHTTHDYCPVQAFVNTMKQVLPSVYTFNVPNSINTEIIATKEPTSITTFQQNLARFAPTSTLGQITNEVLPVV